MKSLQVSLGDRSYPIHIGTGALDDRSLFQKAITGKQVLVVTNDTVEPLYGATLLKTLSSFCQVDILVLPDGEQHKHLETISQIYDHLLRNKYHRTATLIALGGGGRWGYVWICGSHLPTRCQFYSGSHYAVGAGRFVSGG